MTELGLSSSELIVFAIIYGFTVSTEEHVCTASLDYLADWAGVSRMQVTRVIKALTEKGLVIKENVRRNNTNRCNYKAVINHSNNTLPCNESIVTKCDYDSNNTLPCHSNKMSPYNIDNNRIEKKDSVCEIDTRAGAHTHTHEKQVSPKPQSHSDDMEERESCAKEKEPDLSFPVRGMQWEKDDCFFLDGRYAYKRDHSDWKSLVEKQKTAKRNFPQLFASKYSLLGTHPRPLTWDEFQVCLYLWGRAKTESLLMQLDAKTENLKYDTVMKGLRIFHEYAKN